MNTIKRTLDSRIARRSVGWVFYIFLVYFIFNYIREIDFSQISSLAINIPLLITASFVSLGFRYWGAVIWLVLLKDLGASISNYPILFYVYAKSWLGRYLPGKVTWILGRIYFASGQGISKSSLAMSATMESGLQIAVVMALSLIFLSLDDRFNVVSSELRFLMLVASIVILIFLTPKLFNWLFKLIYSKVKKQPFTLKVSRATLLKGISLYVVSYFITGVAYFLFARAIYPELGFDAIFYIIGTFNLAGAVGILAFFAPSGLGVREGVQLLLLGAIMPAEVALVLTITSRIWSVAIDFIFYLSAFLLKSAKRA